MAITDRMIERVKRHEGYKVTPYKDTVDKWTVGYGRNLEDNTLTVSEVVSLFNRTEFKSTVDAQVFFEELLVHDLKKRQEELEEWLAMWPLCAENEKVVLLDMAYNMGLAGLLSFEGMLHAIDNEDQVQAAVELLDSHYAEQTKIRAVDNAKLLAGTQYNEVKTRLRQQNYGRFMRLEPYM